MKGSMKVFKKILENFPVKSTEKNSFSSVVMNNFYGNPVNCNLEASYLNRLQLGGSQNQNASHLQIYAPDPEDIQDEILEKLEQTGRVPSKEKFRRMVCMTFIYTGACPYNDRCVFLHDYRIKAEGMKVKTTRQVKASNLIKDTFYWPDMEKREVIQNMDAQGLTDVNQRYQIPDSFGNVSSNFHNRAIYSLWSHFVAFCMFNRSLKATEFNNMSFEPYFQQSDLKENRYVRGTFRLPVFFEISNVLHLDTHNIALLEDEYNRAFSTPDKLDCYFGTGNNISGRLTDIPRYQTPADAPSLIYGADFTTPQTRKYEEDSRSKSLRRTESVPSIFGGACGTSTPTADMKTGLRRHSFNLGHASPISAVDREDTFGLSVQRSLFAVTPQRNKTTAVDPSTPNLFESFKTSQPSSIWSTERDALTLDIELIHENKATAAALTCVPTARSDSSHLMKGTLSSVDEREDPWKVFEDKLSGCSSSLNSNVDSVSVLTWNNVSQDLFDGFSPYVDISKSEWPSSNAAGSFGSNANFTPRETGSAHILGTLLDSAPMTSGPCSTMSGPNTISPPYLDSGEEDPLSRAAFSPLQTEESFGARSAFRRSNAPEKHSTLFAMEPVRNPVSQALSFESLFPPTPVSAPASGDTAFPIDNFSRGGIGDATMSSGGSGGSAHGQRNQTAFQVMSQGHQNVAGSSQPNGGQGYFAQQFQTHLSVSKSLHASQQMPPNTLTPLDRSLYSLSENGDAGTGTRRMHEVTPSSFKTPVSMQRQHTPQFASPAVTPAPINAFQEDMQRLQLKSLEEKKAAAAAANAVLSRGGAFSTPTKEVRSSQHQDWNSNHYLSPAHKQPARAANSNSASGLSVQTKANVTINSGLRISPPQELSRQSSSAQARPYQQQHSQTMSATPFHPQMSHGPLNQAQLQQNMYYQQQQQQLQYVQQQTQQTLNLQQQQYGMQQQQQQQQHWGSTGSAVSSVGNFQQISPPMGSGGDVARTASTSHYLVEPPQDFPPQNQSRIHHGAQGQRPVQNYGPQPSANAHRF